MTMGLAKRLPPRVFPFDSLRATERWRGNSQTTSINVPSRASSQLNERADPSTLPDVNPLALLEPFQPSRPDDEASTESVELK